VKITAEEVLFNKVVRGSSPRRPTTFTNDFSKLSGVTQISQPPKPCVQLRINCVQIERKTWGYPVGVVGA